MAYTARRPNFLIAIYRNTMTKDEFRRGQKILCVSGAPNKAGIYGCACCRKIADLRRFKKLARRMAKARLRNADRKEFAKQDLGS